MKKRRGSGSKKGEHEYYTRVKAKDLFMNFQTFKKCRVNAVKSWCF